MPLEDLLDRVTSLEVTQEGLKTNINNLKDRVDEQIRVAEKRHDDVMSVLTVQNESVFAIRESLSGVKGKACNPSRYCEDHRQLSKKVTEVSSKQGFMQKILLAVVGITIVAALGGLISNVQGCNRNAQAEQNPPEKIEALMDASPGSIR
jgi:hypothetical protein